MTDETPTRERVNIDDEIARLASEWQTVLERARQENDNPRCLTITVCRTLDLLHDLEAARGRERALYYAAKNIKDNAQMYRGSASVSVELDDYAWLCEAVATVRDAEVKS